MKQAGKAHWLTIAGIVSLLVVAGLFLFGKDTAAETANSFMRALAKGDEQKLTELSYYEGESKEELLRKWEFATEVAKHYQFLAKIRSISHSDERTAAARMQVIRNPQAGGYEENFQLPLVKHEGEWKVDVRAISRNLYPALPR